MKALLLIIIFFISLKIDAQSLSTDSFCLSKGFIIGDSSKYTKPILADMNQDGITDMVFYSFAQKKLMYFKGNGSSFITTPYVTSFTLQAISIAVGNLNGDSYPDVAVLNNNNAIVTTYTNNAGTNLNFNNSISPSGSTSFNTIEKANTIHVATLDYNALYEQIIVTCENSQSNYAGYFIINNANGVFTSPPNTTYISSLSNLGRPVLDFADYNQDGYNDMCMTTSTSANNLIFELSNLGSINSVSPLTYVFSSNAPISSNCEHIISKDINGDYLVDILCLYDGIGGGLFSLINTGSGSFNTSLPAIINQPNATVFFIADLNNDTNLDYLAMNELNGKCFFNKGLANNGAISLANNQYTFSVNSSITYSISNHFALLDVDGNGFIDILSSGSFLDSANIKIIKNYSHPVVITSNNNAVSCSGSSVILTASTNNILTNGYYNWSNGASNTTTISTSIPGAISAKYNFPLPNGGGCSLISNHINVTSATGILPSFTLTSLSNTLCSNQTLTITSNVLGASSYTWSYYATSGSTSPIEYYNDTLKVAQPISSTIYSFTANNSGCYTTGTISPTVYESPNVNFYEGITTFCAGTTGTVGIDFSNPNANMSGYTYQWTNSLGLVVNTMSVLPVSSSSATLLTYYLQVFNKGCPSNIQQYDLTFKALPIISASVTPKICKGQIAQFNDQYNSSYNYETISSGTFTNNTNTFTVSPLSTEQYTFTSTDFNTGPSCSSIFTFTIVVDTIPILQINGINTICAGQPSTLTASGAQTFTWSNGVNSNSIIVSPITSQTYSVTGTNGLCPNSSVGLNINVNPLPSISVTPFFLICPSQNVTINPTGAVSYTLIGNNINQTSNSFNFTPTTSSTYSIYGTDTKNCIGVTQTTINIINNLNVSAHANPSVVCIGNSSTLTINGGVPTPSSFQGQVVIPITNTNYTVSIKDTSGCDYLKTVIVIVKENCDPKVINAFSPNDDGINDSFYIDGIDPQKNKVTIFDRWGVKLFETNNYNNLTNAWNGKYKGTFMPSGTYFYIIELIESEKTLKGWLEITGR